MNKSIICLAIILCCATGLYSLDYKGKELFLYGNSASSQGRGATGVSSFGIDLFSLNPAAIGLQERFGMSLQYGSLGGALNNPAFVLAFPTSYGVIGSSFRYFYMPDAADFSRGTGISIGIAKDFTSSITLGMALNFFYAQSDTGNAYYTGATIGWIYKFMRSRNRGFGLFNPNLGVSADFGVPFGSQNEMTRFNSLTVGYSFQFYRAEKFSAGFYNDLSAINFYRNYPAKFGVELVLLNDIIARGGVVYPQSYDYGDFTAGAGYRIRSSVLNGSVNYSLTRYRGFSFIHYIGLTVSWGSPDRTPPVTEIIPNTVFISPNGDGTQDYVLFKLNVQDESRIKGWKLQILDSDNRAVKEFRISDRDAIEGLSFSGFFRRLVQKKESTVIPESVMWDGTDNNSAVMPDGVYAFAFTAWDGRGNIAAVKSGKIFVDTTPPAVELKYGEKLFSPNGDGNKDLFIITMDVKSSSGDEWAAGFKNAEGKTVRSYSWRGDAAPKELSWDGKDDAGNETPEGLYQFFMRCADKAGNNAAVVINEISLTRKYETADITLDTEYFSKSNNKDVKLFPRLSSEKGLRGWKIQVMNFQKDIVRVIEGKNELPKVLAWDGKNKNGTVPDDGVYYIKFISEFESGNTPASFEKKLIFDGTAPEVRLSRSPKLFSPDGDGENDFLTIKAGAADPFGLKEWRINIFSPSGVVFKSYSGKGPPPAEIIWDGTGDSRDLVESAADYLIELTAVDNAGNTAVSGKSKINVDILVVVTERGLKMRISNIEFIFGQSELLKNGADILDRVYEILGKYRDYTIQIEGHTDDIGDDAFNLELSEKRAKAVYDYLVKRGMDKNRLTIIGMGETMPLYPNTGEENRRRNRRVEFLLMKKTAEDGGPDRKSPEPKQ